MDLFQKIREKEDRAFEDTDTDERIGALEFAVDLPRELLDPLLEILLGNQCSQALRQTFKLHSESSSVLRRLQRWSIER